VRVVFTACPEPYATAAELSESVRHHGVLELHASRQDGLAAAGDTAR
jgi:hypothetical protein